MLPEDAPDPRDGRPRDRVEILVAGGDDFTFHPPGDREEKGVAAVFPSAARKSLWASHRLNTSATVLVCSSSRIDPDRATSAKASSRKSAIGAEASRTPSAPGRGPTSGSSAREAGS